MVREVRYQVEVKGFRTIEITLVTTLLDAHVYTKEALIELYFQRWEIEIDLRHLKTTMKMEHLPCKTPEMVRKDFYMHLLAYNLIRTIMFQSSVEYGGTPLDISFQATIQHQHNFSYALAYADARTLDRLYKTLLYLVSKERLLIRTGRVEPRLKKRRPKDYKYLQKPRRQLRMELIA
jgi:hypothetical protein